MKQIIPKRRITGMSAILLPFDEAGNVDWDAFVAHVDRTSAVGLIPAVNMDTGYANLIDEPTRAKALARTQETLGGQQFVAGAYVADAAGDAFDLDAYKTAIDAIGEHGGMPILFQSYGLAHDENTHAIDAYERIAEHCDRFLAFELSTQFAPFGRIYDLDDYARLLAIDACVGAKHSSLDRSLEWQRLELRDQRRPDFLALTGNDLAIDMVMYGSDYLLGLSTFAPDFFAQRDLYWQNGDERFYELNDWLQYLGFFAFRHPVPAYKHSAAQFLHLRGWAATNRTHPQSPARPNGDIELLRHILTNLEAQVVERS